MEEMQSIVKRIETNHDDLEAWQRLAELVDDPQKKNDCRDQITRIQKELSSAGKLSVDGQSLAASISKPLRTAHRRRRYTLAAIIISNLLPVFGILFLGWSMGSVMILYWVENVIVGFFTVLKITFAGAQAGSGLGKLVIILFFCVHFGMFCVGHLIFITTLFLPRMLLAGGLRNMPWNMLNFLADLCVPILGMFISYSIYFYQHYLGEEIYKRASLTSLIFEPYPRIIPLQLGIILGGFLFLALRSPFWIVLVLVALKTIAEVLTYRSSRRKWRSQSSRMQLLQI